MPSTDHVGQPTPRRGRGLQSLTALFRESDSLHDLSTLSDRSSCSVHIQILYIVGRDLPSLWHHTWQLYCTYTIRSCTNWPCTYTKLNNSILVTWYVHGLSYWKQLALFTHSSVPIIVSVLVPQDPKETG